MQFVFPPRPVITVPVQGNQLAYPVGRIFCVGRNYTAHAKEMGGSGSAKEPPFFFMKPASCVLAGQSEDAQVLDLPYPPNCQELHHELELVVALGSGGEHIAPSDANAHIYGYALGLDMTRRDIQTTLKNEGKPWEAAKAFDSAAPMGCITPVAIHGHVAQSMPMQLECCNEKGQRTIRQQASTHEMIWSVPEIIAELSKIWALSAGDVIYTGTPAGVASVHVGDTLVATAQRLPTLQVRVIPHRGNG